MNEHELIFTILLLFASAVMAVVLLRQIHLPSIFAYLLVGTLLGPFVLDWLPALAHTRFLAELGIAFLLFMIGLEFSLPTLLAARKAVFGLGGLQMLITTALGLLLARYWGFSWEMSLLLGGAVAMSSTAVVLRQLAEQTEINTRHGRMAVGILLFQDLATVPFLALVSALSAAQAHPADVGYSLLQALGMFILLGWVGRKLVRPLMHFVARQHSSELFMLTVLLLIFGAAGGAVLAHLSLPLGAFLAGMVLGETEFRHQIEADIRPFQNVLLGLFFITVGMQLNPAVLWTSGAIIIGLLFLIVVGKTLLISLLGWLLGYHPGIALRTGLALGQVGEFGLLIVTLSLQAQLLSPAVGQVVLAVMILSMALTPLLIRWNGPLVKQLSILGYREYLAQQQHATQQLGQNLDNHVILCGYGRVGQNLARLLELEDIPYLALDMDAERVRRAQLHEEPVVYGDAARLALLKAAKIEQARALVITVGEPRTNLKILQQARHLCQDLPILVRGTDVRELGHLLEAGATQVLPETLEASLLLGVQLLAQLDVPQTRVEAYVAAARADQYQFLRQKPH